MKTITLEFPKGLQSRLTNLLNAISQNIIETKGSLITIEYIGLNDNYLGSLHNFEFFNNIKVVK